MKKTKQKKSFICHNCGEKQTKAIQQQTCEVFYEYDLETEEYEKTEENNFRDSEWFCPDCDHPLTDEQTKNFN